MNTGICQVFSQFYGIAHFLMAEDLIKPYIMCVYLTI
jgi:hypothetical protein